MRLLSARLIISLIIGVTLVLALPRTTRCLWPTAGCARICSTALSCSVKAWRRMWNATWSGMPALLQRTVQQFANREHLAGLAVYDPQGQPLAVTTNLQPLMTSAPPVVMQALKEDHDTSAFLRMGIASIHIYALPLHHGDDLIGSLAIVHDAGYIRARA